MGIPIGNLLSQTYALIYMNPLDHFIKRDLGAKHYCRYVDDFVIFGWPRERCVAALAQIEAFIADELHMSLSRYSLHKCRRGINFVGFRTWRSTRFVRKHSLYTFTKAAKSGNTQAVASCLGHAKRTASLRNMLNFLKGIS